MSNAQGKKAPSTGAAEDKQAAQQAQQDEAADAPRTFDFDGHTYHVLDGQPSPKAITYIARWSVDDENLAMVLAIVEMIGTEQWQRWCDNHPSERINPFWSALNKAASGSEGN